LEFIDIEAAPFNHGFQPVDTRFSSAHRRLHPEYGFRVKAVAVGNKKKVVIIYW